MSTKAITNPTECVAAVSQALQARNDDDGVALYDAGNHPDGVKLPAEWVEPDHCATMF